MNEGLTTKINSYINVFNKRLDNRIDRADIEMTQAFKAHEQLVIGELK